MLVVFVNGMPSSGKTTLADLLAYRFASIHRLLYEGIVPAIAVFEMSKVVREWQTNLGHEDAESLLKTELHSNLLYKSMWKRTLGKSICIISGVREAFLMDTSYMHEQYLGYPPQIPCIIKVGLIASADAREARYGQRTHNPFLFKDAEARAVEMSVEAMLQDSDVLLDAETASSDELVYLALTSIGKIISDRSINLDHRGMIT